MHGRKVWSRQGLSKFACARYRCGERDADLCDILSELVIKDSRPVQNCLPDLIAFATG